MSVHFRSKKQSLWQQMPGARACPAMPCWFFSTGPPDWLAHVTQSFHHPISILTHVWPPTKLAVPGNQFWPMVSSSFLKDIEPVFLHFKVQLLIWTNASWKPDHYLAIKLYLGYMTWILHSAGKKCYIILLLGSKHFPHSLKFPPSASWSHPDIQQYFKTPSSTNDLCDAFHVHNPPPTPVYLLQNKLPAAAMGSHQPLQQWLQNAWWQWAVCCVFCSMACDSIIILFCCH